MPTDASPPVRDEANLTRSRILSFDGGPSSALQIRIFKRLEEEVPGLLASVTHFAGTSNGSFVSLYLASHRTSDHARNLEVIQRCIEFNDKILAAFNPSACDWLRLMSGWGPMIKGEALEEVLVSGLGDQRVADLQAHLTIVSFCLSTGSAAVFSNAVPEPWFDPKAWSLVDLALASSAFPLVLPIYRHARTGMQFVDGGFTANDPVLAAASRFIGAQDRGAPVDMLAMSLGAWQTLWKKSELREWIVKLIQRTSSANRFVNWGYLEWLLHNPLLKLELILLGSSSETSQQGRHMLGDTFRRYQPPMHELMDALEIMGVLGNRTEDVIKSLDEGAAKLTDPASPLSLGFRETVSWLKGKGWVPPST